MWIEVVGCLMRLNLNSKSILNRASDMVINTSFSLHVTNPELGGLTSHVCHRWAHWLGQRLADSSGESDLAMPVFV